MLRRAPPVRAKRWRRLADEQRVSWINLSERASFMVRRLAHFSLFVMPQIR